ncbi:MAG TPA: GspMb/PilO family protein [Candidatus Omnitrophota bacterium]|nr:GspMb/PilO family protein [Candidatus Omnitrophota bacterium]
MIKLPNLKALQVFLGRLSKKDKIIFYIAVFVVSLMVLDRAIISPVFNKIRSLNKEVKDEQATIKKNLRILAQKDRILSEGAKYSSFLGDAQLSDDEQITLVLKEIESLASKSSVYLVDMKPSGTKESGSSKRIMINLNCEAQMEQLVDFMYNLENSNILLSIEKYQLTPKTKESSVAKCSISVYKVVAL